MELSENQEKLLAYFYFNDFWQSPKRKSTIWERGEVTVHWKSCEKLRKAGYLKRRVNPSYFKSGYQYKLKTPFKNN